MRSRGYFAAHGVRGGGISVISQTITLEAGNSGSTSFSFSLSNDGLSMSFSGGNSFANSEESTTVNGVRTAYEAINSTHSSHSMSMGFDYADDRSKIECTGVEVPVTYSHGRTVFLQA